MAKEDYVFAATVASYARNVTVLKEVVYRYRANEDRSRESGSQRLSNDFFRDIFVASKLSEKVLQCNNASHAAIREKNRAIVDFLENRIPRKLRQIETEEEYEEFREIVEEGFGCIPADAIGHLNRHMYLFAALLISHATDEAFSVFDSTADMKHFFNVNRVQLESLPPDQLISLLIRFTPQLRRDARRGVNTTAEKLVRQFERLIVSIGKVKNDLVATARRTYHTAMYPFVLSKAYLADASIEACPAINTSTLPIWLFGERYGSHAGDNAYTLYRYVQDHHSDKISAYFVLKESSNLFEPLSTDPSLLAYGSSEHANVFAKADVYLFTDKLRDVIGNATLVHRLVSSDLLGSRSFVMLHHGVMYLKTTAFKNYHRKNFGHPIDLYVANSAFEKENLMEHSGFSEQQVQVVGFARFDELRAFKNEKNYILFMPTWRRGMGSWSIARFKRSIYFKRIQALLSSEELNEILEKSGQVLKLNLHFNMRRWIDVFESSSSHIEIVQDPDASVTELLCKCSALISDYSGVCFDVAYMDKPVLFFDLGMENEDVLGQAPISPNFKNEIFGPVCTDVGHLVQEIASTIDLNFVMKPQYLERREKFFDSVDERNLERIFNAVNDISESKRLARR
ncbi:MAG: CDP-glycerol glycerophosphotransferase family protein [Hyphomicrobiales bacterium]